MPLWYTSGPSAGDVGSKQNIRMEHRLRERACERARDRRCYTTMYSELYARGSPPLLESLGYIAETAEQAKRCTY